MKRISFIIVFILLFSFSSHSADISIEYFRQSNQSENFGNADGLKLTIGPNDSIFYAWLSGEYFRFNLTGQNFDHAKMLGAGLGVKYRPRKSPFAIFFDAGYFMPFHDKMGDELLVDHGDRGDRCEIYLNEKYAPIYGLHTFDYYTMEMSGNMGASFGVKYFIKGFTVGFAYRILEIPLRVNGHSYTDPAYAWERYEDQNVSGPMFTIGYQW